MACAANIEQSQTNQTTPQLVPRSMQRAVVVDGGVGARVIRGPDWKWGKQVSVFLEIKASLGTY